MENIFEKACQYALIKHKNQYRKDGSIYILHPFEVATIAGTMTNDLDVLSAAVLHDVLEDSDASLIEIKELFNDRVCKLISLETEEKYPNLSKKDSWKLRKIEAIKRLEETDDIGFKIIYLADKLSNIRSLLRDINNNGIQAFNKFNVSNIDEQAWYYYSVLDNLKELKNTSAYFELSSKLEIIFNKNKELNDGKKSNTL